MRQIVAIIGLTVALLLGVAEPAAAHHTHSPSVKCGELVNAWNAAVYGNPYVLQSYSQIYRSDGHPDRAKCWIRNNLNFQVYCRQIYYTTHKVIYC